MAAGQLFRACICCNSCFCNLRDKTSRRLYFKISTISSFGSLRSRTYFLPGVRVFSYPCVISNALYRFLLTLDTSPLAEQLRTEQEAASIADSEDVTITVTQNLKDAFLKSLKERNISLRFIAGSWDAILSKKDLFESPFDVVLTSETIYRTDSVPTLISLLRLACGEDDSRMSSERGLESSVEKLSLQTGALCFVAAKILYFGVGGSIIDFQKSVEAQEGKSNVVYKKESGVGRQVLAVQWTKQ